VFVVRGRTLVIPPVSAGALAGVVRDTVTVLARDAGYEVVEENLTRTDLYGADECFLTGTAAGVLPVLSVDRRPVGTGTAGAVTSRLAALTALGCLSSTEPTGGSDLAGLRTTARRDGDGWYLAGRKRYISNLGGATHTLVLARLADRLNPRDLSLFVVPMAAPGVTVRGFFPALGLSACDVGEVEFDVRLPPDALLGASGMGLAYLSRLLQFERLSIIAQLATEARTALGLAVAFAQRRAIGTGQLIDKQAVRHRLAHCQAQLWLLEAGLRDLVERTAAGLGVGHQTAALKYNASRIAETITDECLQVFGAHGYTANYPLERIWRDVRLARIGGGSEEVMIEVVASRLDRPDPYWNARLDALEAADLPVPG
jgi:alkylation response protein AidB-like acyl-CoA dehydrogenase